jgi:hypothetical protein
MSTSAVVDVLKNCAIGGVVGCGGVVKTLTTNGFDDTSNGLITVIIIIVVLAVIVWILSLVATYRLTDSVLQVILAFFLGSIYIFFAWTIYGMTGHKLVKMTKL